MNQHEIDICKRFSQIRANKKMKQGEFAKEITLTQGHVSDIENGRKCVSGRVMEIICLKYNVDKEWFRNGTGEMYLPENTDDRYAVNIGKLQRTDNETIMRWVNTIAETSPETLEKIEEFMKKLIGIE